MGVFIMKLVARFKQLQDYELMRIKACTGPNNLDIIKIGQDTIISATGDMAELIGVIHIFEKYKYKEMELQR